MRCNKIDNIKQLISSPSFFPWVIVFCAVLLRGFYFAEMVHSPAFSHPIYDPEYNAYWARGIAEGNWTVPPGMEDPEITTTPHGRPPGYPWFLGGVYFLFGVNEYAPRLIQMLLGVINALLLYYIGKRIYGRIVGGIAGIFMALYWVFPYFEGILTYPVVAVFILLCLIATLIRWHETLSMRWAASAGVMLGIFALFRPNGLLLLPLIAAWFAWKLWQSSRPVRHVLVVGVVFVLGCAAALAPAFIRNYMVSRDFVFISSYGGINFYVGNHPQASLVEPRIPELMDLAGLENWSCFDYPRIVRGIAAQQGKDLIRYSDANRYFYRGAIKFIRDYPDVFVTNLVKKMFLFWGPREITNDTVMEYDKRFSRILCRLPGFPWVAALFASGSVLLLYDMLRKKSALNSDVKTISLLLWLIVAGYMFSVIIYFVAGRYRVPIIPVLLLIGAYGVHSALAAILEGRRLFFLICLFMFIFFSLFFHWNITGYEPSQGTWHVRTAMAWTAAGNDEAAEAEYNNALKCGAVSSVVYANLGRLHLNRGERETGLNLYREGLLLNPHNSTIRNNLGYELYKDGEIDEAITHFQEAIKTNPHFPLAHINLGNAFFDKGKYDAAREHFREAARWVPNNAVVHYNIARTWFAENELSEAAEAYHKALQMDPEFVEALNNLGYVFAVQGNYEQAIVYYRRALALNPTYSLACNNLGNALLELGEMEQAVNTYQQALENNPRDVYALYNLGRVNMKLGEWPEAENRFRHCIELSPEFRDASLLLGDACAAQKNFTEAIIAYEHILESHPHDEETLLRMAECLEDNGETDKALDVYSRLLTPK